MRARHLLLLLVMLLAACSEVGPNYQVPAQAVVNTPQARQAFTAGRTAATAEPLPDHWWKLFDDPNLGRLIEQALAANTDLRVAEANLSRSAALLREARTAREADGRATAETTWAQRSAEEVLAHVQPPERLHRTPLRIAEIQV